MVHCAWIRGARWAVLAGLLSATVLLAHPDVDRQIADITLRIEDDPRNAQLYLRRGELHRIHRNLPDAKKDFRRARKIEPDLDSVDYHLGRLQLDAGKPKQSRKLLDRFLTRQPSNTKGLVARAQAWIALGEPERATDDFAAAIGAHGSDRRPDPSLYLDRARLLAELGELQTAIQGLDQGLARLGEPVTLQLYAIEIELERGRHDAALARLDRIAAHAQRQETWLVRRGEILATAGRVNEARRAYADALDAIDALPASRRGSRAMQRLKANAESALERLADRAQGG